MHEMRRVTYHFECAIRSAVATYVSASGAGIGSWMVPSVASFHAKSPVCVHEDRLVVNFDSRNVA